MSIIDWCTRNLRTMYIVLISAVVLLICGIITAGRFADSWHDKAEAKAAEAALLHEQGARQQVVIDELKAKMAEERQLNAEMSKKLAAALAKVPTVPPKPAPPPPDASVLAYELSTAGLAGPLVGGAGPSTLPVNEAQLVVGWHREFSRVPALEARIKADAEVKKSCAELVTGLGAELTSCRGVVVAQDSRYDLSQKEWAAKTEGLNYQVKEYKAKNVSLKIKLVVSVPITAYITYRLMRR